MSLELREAPVTEKFRGDSFVPGMTAADSERMAVSYGVRRRHERPQPTYDTIADELYAQGVTRNGKKIHAAWLSVHCVEADPTLRIYKKGIRRQKKRKAQAQPALALSFPPAKPAAKPTGAAALCQSIRTILDVDGLDDEHKIKCVKAILTNTEASR